LLFAMVAQQKMCTGPKDCARAVLHMKLVKACSGLACTSQRTTISFTW